MNKLVAASEKSRGELLKCIAQADQSIVKNEVKAAKANLAEEKKHEK